MTNRADIAQRAADLCTSMMDVDEGNPGQLRKAIWDAATLLHEVAVLLVTPAALVDLPKPRGDGPLKRELAALAARVDAIEKSPASEVPEAAPPGEPVTLPHDVAEALYRLTLIGMEVLGADVARCTTETGRAAMAAANEPLAKAGLYLQQALGKGMP